MTSPQPSQPADVVDPKATEMMHGAMPFAAELGIEVLRDLSAAESPEGDDNAVVRSRMAWSATKCTAGGVLHGGAIMALADANGGLCAFLNLPAGAAGTTTIESKTNFLRPIRDGYATAASRALHRGKRIVVVETDVVDDRQRLVARVTQTQAVL